MNEKNEKSNFKEVLKRYLHLSGIRIVVFLEDGTKVYLENAVIKNDKIINRYYEDLNGNVIPIEKIKYAELYAY
jgi:hypothetical protein